MRKMFSKNQIKRMVAESPEEVVEALANQDVKVKTIEQSEANFEFDFSEAMQTAFDNTPALADCELTIAFAKCQVFDRILLIVASFKITNNGETSVSAGSFSPRIDLTPIASKIYDQNGTPLSQSTDANTRIAGAVSITSNARYGSHSVVATSLYRETSANIAILSLDYKAMNAGHSSYTDLRLELIV